MTTKEQWEEEETTRSRSRRHDGPRSRRSVTPSARSASRQTKKERRSPDGRAERSPVRDDSAPSGRGRRGSGSKRHPSPRPGRASGRKGIAAAPVVVDVGNTGLQWQITRDKLKEVMSGQHLELVPIIAQLKKALKRTGPSPPVDLPKASDVIVQELTAEDNKCQAMVARMGK